MFHVERHGLNTAHLRLEHYLVPWDSEIFGQPVAQLESLQLRGGEHSAALADFAAYERWRDAQRVALEVAKLDEGQLPELSFLESQGFRWMETQYRLDWRLGAEAPALDAGLSVAPLREVDRAAVDAVAASAFETSRFALDPAIGSALAGRRYKTWLRNALASESQQLLVAHGEDGKLLGFFVVEQQGEDAYWHLTAIDPARQGSGYGLRLWRHMMAWQVARGVRRIRTSVSGHNLRVLGLYGRLGFRFAQAQFSLHRGGLQAPENAHES